MLVTNAPATSLYGRTALRSLVSRAWHSPTLTTWASLLTRSLNLALVLPLALRLLSPGEALVWQLIVTMAGIQLLLDLGMTVTFARLFSYARGGAERFDRQEFGSGVIADKPPNWTGAEAIWATQSRLFWLLGGVSCLLMLSSGSWFLLAKISTLPNPLAAWIAWGLVIFGAPAAFRTMAYSSWLLGMNAVGELRRTEALCSLAAIVTTLLVLAFGGKLLALTVCSQLLVWLNLLRNRWLARRIEGGRLKTFRTANTDAAVWKSVWPLAWRSGVGALLGSGMVQMSGLVAAKISGQKNEVEATAFLIALRVATAVSQFSQAPFASKLSTLATLRSRGDRTGLLLVARRGILLAHWTFAASALAAALGMPILLKFAGSRIPFVGLPLWWALCVALFVERYGAMNLQVYSTSNHILWHKANGGAAIIMIAAGLLLVPSLGLLGLPLAILAGNLLFYSVYSSRLMYRDLDLQPAAWERSLTLPPLLCLLAAAAVSLFVSNYVR